MRCMCAAVAQTRATDMSQAPGILPSGLGDAVDRDVMKIREATAKFQTTEAAEAAGYKLVNRLRPTSTGGRDGLSL